MTTNLTNLYEFTLKSLEPTKLATDCLSETDAFLWRNYLSKQTKELQFKLVSFLTSPVHDDEKWRSMSSVQQQLIFISDQLSNFLFREKRIWLSHSRAATIRSNYLFSISCIEELLTYAERHFPEYFDANLKLSKFRLRSLLPELRSEMNQLAVLLGKWTIPIRLLNCVVGGLNDLINGGPSKSNERYIRHLCRRLRSVPPSDESSLTAMLIELDFNQPEFYLLQIDRLDQRLLDVHGLTEQQELLWQHKYQIQRIKPDSRFRLYPKQSSITTDLQQYFSEREAALEALLDLRRAAAKDKVSADQAFRILMDMTVPQIALFFRIQMEVGLMLKDQITEVFNFVAQHFYTEKAHFISSSNMLKLSTTVEFNTVLKVYDMLNMMIKWLDDQFAVKNYSR